MNGKRLFIIFSILSLVVFGGCPPYYGDYDVHLVHYQNNSSHNIYIQYFLDRDWYTQWHNYDGAEGNVYRVTVDELPVNSNFTIGFNSSDYSPISKILFVDTDSQRLLRKIETDWDSFLNTLITEKRVEKNHDNQRVTYYDHHFIITDKLLNRE